MNSNGDVSYDSELKADHEDEDLETLRKTYIKKIKKEIKERSRIDTRAKSTSILQFKFHEKLNNAIKNKVAQSK